MLRFVPYILKTLSRHRTRTILTVSGAGVALFLFCFVGAVQEALDDLRGRQETGQTLVVFQANKFCPATSHLPQDYEQTIRAVAGIHEVVPIQVFTNNCRASLDVVVFYGLPAQKLRQVRNFTLVEGNVLEYERHQDAAMVGAMVAQRRQIGVGDKFSIGAITVSVAGVYTSDDPAEQNYIYTHLDFLQRGRSWNRVGTVTQFEVFLEPGVAPVAKCKEIDDAFRVGPVPTKTQPKRVFQAQSLGDLTELIGLARYLGFACVVLVFMLVCTTTLMSVQDRVQEYAVLRTIGYSNSRVFCFVLAESTVLSLLGGSVGVAAVVSVLQFSNLAVGAEGVMMAFQPSLALAVTGLLVSLVIGVLAGIAPAYQAVATGIVPGLRQ